MLEVFSSIHAFLMSFVIIFLILKFYIRVQGEEVSRRKILLISIVYSLFRMYIHGEFPTRVIISLSFLFLSLLLSLIIKCRNVEFKVLFIIFLFGHVFHFLSLFIVAFLAGIILFLTAREPEPTVIVLSLLYPLIALGSIFFSETRIDKIFQKYSPIVKQLSARGIALTIGLFLISLYIILDFGVNYLEIFSELIPSLVIASIGLILMSAIVYGITLIIKHLEKTDAKITHLENSTTQLAKENEKLINKWHEVKEMIAVNNLSFMELESALVEADGFVNAKLLDKIERVKAFNLEIGIDLSIADLKEDLDRLELGGGFAGLKLLLVRFIYEARRENIRLDIENEFEEWGTLDIPESLLIKLMGNILTNALKELRKQSEIVKEVKIYFFQDSRESFNIEIYDNANQFSVQVLQKLGERRNSTNGTGNGYFEIFSILDAALATFRLQENLHMKKISLVFDGKNQRIIQSSYRTEELLIELENAKLDVLF